MSVANMFGGAEAEVNLRGGLFGSPGAFCDVIGHSPATAILWKALFGGINKAIAQFKSPADKKGHTLQNNQAKNNFFTPEF